MFAISPRVDRYFRDGWNAFDFLAISCLIIGIVAVSSVADYVILIILVPLLRLLQGLSTVQELRLILAGADSLHTERGARRGLAGHRLLRVCLCRAAEFRRARPGVLGKSSRFRFVAASNGDAGRLGHDHGRRHRVRAVGVGRLCQLRDNQCLYRNQSIHSRRNKKPGRSQGGTSMTVGNAHIQGRTPPGTALNPASAPPPGRTHAKVPRLVVSLSGHGNTTKSITEKRRVNPRDSLESRFPKITLPLPPIRWTCDNHIHAGVREVPN